MDAADYYSELRRQSPNARRDWARIHAPKDRKANWWWALLDRVQADVARPQDGLTRDYAGDVLLAIDFVELAVSDGMPAYLGARWFARIASASHSGVGGDAGPPDGLGPDDVAKRILGTFRLSQTEALAVAARRRIESLTNDDAWIRPGEPIAVTYDDRDAELAWLQEIEYLLPDLALVAPNMADGDLAEIVRSWLSLRDQLDGGPEVAQRGRELLARWREELSGDTRGRNDSDDE